MSSPNIGSIYDYPNLYDVLFSDLNKLEVAFLTSVFERFGNQKGIVSLFEPACGSGRLLYQLAKRGFDVAGLDLNPRAVEYCNRRLKHHGFQETAYVGNMVSFSLADVGKKTMFDGAFNFVSSFLHLTTEDEAVQHLRTMAKTLRMGGLYLLGIHLKPKGKQYCTQERWSVRQGSLFVKSHLQTLSQDLENRIENIEMRIEAETPKKRYSIVDRFPFRIYTAEQFYDLLDSADRFSIVETYSFDYDVSQPITITEETEDVVFVLKKRR